MHILKRAVSQVQFMDILQVGVKELALSYLGDLVLRQIYCLQIIAEMVWHHGKFLACALGRLFASDPLTTARFTVLPHISGRAK